MLDRAQKKRLLGVARKSLEKYLASGKREEFTETDSSLTRECGAFVTLTKHGQLRGCIGHIVGDKPLYETIAAMAIEAGTGDPRFPSATLAELKDIEIEISVLSPLELIDDVEKIEVGKHGILIRKGFQSGLLLPQVATEYNWDRDMFLTQTCHKAGLAADAWKDESIQIYIFSAVVFREKEFK